MPDGNDLVILGIVLELAGGYLLARGVLGSASPKAAETRVGANPIILKALMKAHADAMAGFLWLGIGLVASMAGTVRSTYSGQPGLIATSLWVVPGVLVLGALVLAVSIPLVDRVARRKCTAIFRTTQRKRFARAVDILQHDGLRSEEITAHAAVSQEVRNERMQDAKETLNEVASLFDEPARPGEDHHSIANRLRRHLGE